jgi:hypothetical protein
MTAKSAKVGESFELTVQAKASDRCSKLDNHTPLLGTSLQCIVKAPFIELQLQDVNLSHLTRVELFHPQQFI